MNTDELALRHLLQDLTAGQPPAPIGRYEAVRRRVIRRRWTQAAVRGVALAAVGIVAVGAAVLPASKGGAAAGSRAVPGWALPWPDHRDGSVPRRVLDGAVTAWRDVSRAGAGNSRPDVRRVIWYVGQTAANGYDVIVTFEASTASGNYLVAGYAVASDVMNSTNPSASASTAWVLYSAPAPHRRSDLTVGLNLPVASGGAQSADNWIMVLAAPDVRSMTWTAPQGTFPISGSAEIGASTTEHGLAITNTGQITGPVQLTALTVGHRNILPSETYVEVPGSVVPAGTQASDVPALTSPAGLYAPSGFGLALGATGQGTSYGLLRNQIISGRAAVIARCYGPSPLRVYLDARLLGVIECDNGVHELAARARTRSPVDLYVKTSFLTAWRIYIGSVG